jgi:predicted RNA binding protein YcfA (HicA-like mRNA interferase family)
MGALPSQLPWRRFVCILRALGYEQLASHGGSARSFHNRNREPHVVTFHEPHKGDNLREGTLRSYLRKLNLLRPRFLDLLRDC